MFEQQRTELGVHFLRLLGGLLAIASSLAPRFHVDSDLAYLTGRFKTGSIRSGDGAVDEIVGSPEVKALDGWMQIWSAPTGGQAKQQVVAQANRGQASKTHSSPESECEEVGNAETFIPS